MNANQPLSRTATRGLVGIAAASTLSLVYGLARPETLEFSIPFLMAPSLALLAPLVAADPVAKRPAIWITIGIVLGTTFVLLATSLIA
jgi:hypothetical protein